MKLALTAFLLLVGVPSLVWAAGKVSSAIIEEDMAAAEQAAKDEVMPDDKGVDEFAVSEEADPPTAPTDAEYANSIKEEDPAAASSNNVTPKIYTKAVLNVLDKVAGKSIEVVFAVRQDNRYGNLSINLVNCQDTTDPHSQRAWLEILENRKGRPNTIQFKGWMFSDSPSLSALDNPEYDVTLVRCE